MDCCKKRDILALKHSLQLYGGMLSVDLNDDINSTQTCRQKLKGLIPCFPQFFFNFLINLTCVCVCGGGGGEGAWVRGGTNKQDNG